MSFLRDYFLQGGLIIVVALLIVQTFRLNATQLELSNKKLEHSQIMGEIAEKTNEAYEKLVKDLKESQALVSQIDTQKTKELNDAIAENNRLRSALRNGELRMRVFTNGGTPVATTTTAESATPTRVDDAATEVPPAVGQAILDVREAVIHDTKALEGLQQYVNDVCLKVNTQ